MCVFYNFLIKMPKLEKKSLTIIVFTIILIFSISIIILVIDVNDINNSFSNIHLSSVDSLGHSSNRELLSADVQITDGQPVRTYNGKIPKTQCPAGSYRPSGGSNLVLVSGQLNDGCVQCPRGRYGSSVGSSNPNCDDGCPVGRFGRRLGLTKVAECELCPPGKYGAVIGSSSQCDGACPKGTYNPEYGKTSLKDCLPCPMGYRGWQCNWPVEINKPNQVAWRRKF